MNLSTSHNIAALAGRVLLGAFFLLAGISKITGFAGTVGYMQSKGMPATEVLAALTVALEVGGGLALILGVATRWAALGLAAFTLLAGLIFHNFWAVPEAQRMVQNLMFMKNLAIAGGLLVTAAFGPGSWRLAAFGGRGVDSGAALKPAR